MSSPKDAEDVLEMPLAEHVEWTEAHDKERNLMKLLFALLLAAGSTAITSVLVCFPLFIKEVWTTPDFVPGLIMTVGEGGGLIVLGLSTCVCKEDDHSNKPSEGEEESRRNGCMQDVCQQPILVFVFTISASVMAAVLGFLWRPESEISIRVSSFVNAETSVSSFVNSTNATAEHSYLGETRFWCHAVAEVFMALSNLFLHSSAVELMSLYLPQDMFF